MILTGIEWGSVAAWLSSALTALGIFVSLYWNYLNSRTKIFISTTDVRFKINGHYRTQGDIFVRTYNKSNKPFTIDEVGFKVIKINNKKINKLFVPISTMRKMSDAGNVLLSYSDANFKTNVKNLTGLLNFRAGLGDDDENIAVLIPYIKGPINKCVVGKTKLKINTKTLSINDSPYIWMNEN